MKVMNWCFQTAIVLMQHLVGSFYTCVSLVTNL